MKKITFKGNEYTFKDEYTTEDWMKMEDVEGDTAKMASLRIVAHMSLKPKLTFEQIIKMPFTFTSQAMALINNDNLGEE